MGERFSDGEYVWSHRREWSIEDLKLRHAELEHSLCKIDRKRLIILYVLLWLRVVVWLRIVRWYLIYLK